MSTEHLARIAARLSDWDAHEALHERQREEYEREQIATAQSEEQHRLRMRAGTKRTDSTKD